MWGQRTELSCCHRGTEIQRKRDSETGRQTDREGKKQRLIDRERRGEKEKGKKTKQKCREGKRKRQTDREKGHRQAKYLNRKAKKKKNSKA